MIFSGQVKIKNNEITHKITTFYFIGIYNINFGDSPARIQVYVFLGSGTNAVGSFSKVLIA